ncbi:Flp family type IVb pilin [Actinocorallia longicatena]|uniref:Flp family type IVb pilin n=1 Tax=Actinocorallia longicatena TaxID=111803 RepID=A0ABP6QGD4_9ACTN
MDDGGGKPRTGLDRGATAVEYTLLTVLIAIIAIAGSRALGTALSSRVTSQTGQVSAVVTPSP